MIQISGGKSALWWEQKRQMSGGKSDKLGGGKSDKGKWTTTSFFTKEIKFLAISRLFLTLFRPQNRLFTVFFSLATFHKSQAIKWKNGQKYVPQPLQNLHQFKRLQTLLEIWMVTF